MKTICPICKKKMEREKHWFDGENLVHGCIYCYLRWREEYRKKRNGKENEDSDDIL